MSVEQRIEQFVRREGRRPRILVSNMGKKSHDQDIKLLATTFAEMGFDVDISPLRQTPLGTARVAIENDDHAVCFLSMDNKHNNLVADLTKRLKSDGAENIRIVIGGAIPRTDYDFLYSAGASLILNSRVVDQSAVNDLLDLFE